MALRLKSAGGGESSVNASQTGNDVALSREGEAFQLIEPALALPTLPMRAGDLSIRNLIHLYMAYYAGRDASRSQRLGWWAAKLGSLTLDEVSDDQIHEALESLSERPATYYAGIDAAGDAIYKAKPKQLSPATINRYSASIGAVFTWSIKRRIAPKGFIHPCRAVERRPENNEKTRFLSDDERGRLLLACKASHWPRLYLLTMFALTTGARKSELTELKWRDVDFNHCTAHVGRSKNGDPKVLPIVPVVLELLTLYKGADSSPVFPSPRYPLQAYYFEATWKTALRAAKIKNFRFHDLRHSCASILAQNGATLLEIGDLLGHRQLQVTKRYSHLTTTHKAALVNRVLGGIR